MTYQHTQHAPLGWILALIGAALAATGAFADVRLLLPVGLIGVILIFVALCFATLTIEDEGELLVLRYGPLPLVRKRIAFASITSAFPSRSAFIDGWGIHYIPGRGWTYNLWGRDCVELTVNGRTLRIGSDDAENLASFLQSRI